MLKLRNSTQRTNSHTSGVAAGADRTRSAGAEPQRPCRSCGRPRYAGPPPASAPPGPARITVHRRLDAAAALLATRHDQSLESARGSNLHVGGESGHLDVDVLPDGGSDALTRGLELAVQRAHIGVLARCAQETTARCSITPFPSLHALLVAKRTGTWPGRRTGSVPVAGCRTAWSQVSSW